MKGTLQPSPSNGFILLKCKAKESDLSIYINYSSIYGSDSKHVGS